MNYTTLGKTNIRVSAVCMGCMGFGDAARGQHNWTLGPDASRAIIKQGLDAGINFFDTAVGYSGGTSEQYLGQALGDLARREDVVVATKFTPRTAEEREQGVSGQEHVLHSLETSLEHLGMDYVDLYICHMWDYHTPMEEIVEGMAQAVKSGKARAIGFSNCFAWQLARVNDLCDAQGWPRVASIQGHWNLIFREEEREMIPYCREAGVTPTPYSALASGRLARHPGETTKRLEQDAYAKGKYDATADEDLRVIERVAELAERRGASMTAVSLAWLMVKGAVPVVGMTKPHHVDGAVEACGFALTDEECAYLEEPYVPHALVGVMAENR